MGLTYSSVVPAPLDEVFAWHERPGAVRRLTPPWQRIRVRSETGSLRDDRTVLALPGGVKWIAQHSGYEPPNRFVDELVSLPLHWRHIHEFAAEGADATRVTDRVETPVPAALLRQAFYYRHAQLADDLAVQRAMRTLQRESMTVAMTGSTGLIGSALTPLLTTGGHRVIRLVRHDPRGADERRWRPESPDRSLLDGVDAVVHLAGASIAGRFTEAHKRDIRDSRVEPTRRLAELVAGGPHRPRALVVASAIGYYGPQRGDEQLGEDSPPGEGFLADVVVDWEAASAAAGVRVVTVRTGIVQSPRGGMLRLLRPLFAAGLGGRIGDGRQWTSWIDLDDLTDIYYRALLDERLSGPVNAVSPQPVRNRDYTAALARTMRRPALLPVPPIGPSLLLGAEGARELAVADQRVLPAKLLTAGHRFRRPALDACLAHQLGHLHPIG